MPIAAVMKRPMSFQRDLRQRTGQHLVVEVEPHDERLGDAIPAGLVEEGLQPGSAQREIRKVGRPAIGPRSGAWRAPMRSSRLPSSPGSSGLIELSRREASPAVSRMAQVPS